MTKMPIEPSDLITRREAIQRVTALLGGIALVGGSGLLTGCREGTTTNGAAAANNAKFSTEDIALLDEIADTILPETSTPGAKAAKVGAFMAVMVTDTYASEDQKIFREGMKALDDASQKAHKVSFMQSTPAQRLALLETLDREQKGHMDGRAAARREDARKKRETSAPAVADSVKPQQEKRSDAFLPDQRKENAATADVSGTSAINKDTPTHYFRMMKELALLGYFTSEIGCTKALRYVESPGRYDPCTPYTKGERTWAGHA